MDLAGRAVGLAGQVVVLVGRVVRAVGQMGRAEAREARAVMAVLHRRLPRAGHRMVAAPGHRAHLEDRLLGEEVPHHHHHQEEVAVEEAAGGAVTRTGTRVLGTGEVKAVGCSRCASRS